MRVQVWTIGLSYALLSISCGDVDQAIASAWSDASYPGAWDDGTAANLHISAEIDAQLGCVGTGGEHSMVVPARVRYGSDDGRVAMHETSDAHIYATFSDGHAAILQVLLDESLRCSQGDANFPYLSEACARFDKVQLQFAISEYTYQMGSDTGTALELYKFAKGNASSLADAVERFTLR